MTRVHLAALLLVPSAAAGNDSSSVALCNSIGLVRADVVSQAAFELAPAPPQEDQNGTRWREATVFEGEPVGLSVGTSMFGATPPPSGVVAEILLDNATIAAVPLLRWKRVGRGDATAPYSYVSDRVEIAITPMSIGAHTIKTAVRGCDAGRFWHHSHWATRISVQPTSTSRNRAELHLFRARQRIFDEGDCASARNDLAVAEQFDPEHVLVLSARATCAERDRRFKEALDLYERAEAALQAARRNFQKGERSHFHIRVVGFESEIRRIRDELARRGNVP